ncbi:MAG: hypothetical protein STSR0009_01440 [Methanoregula sp.]
MWMGQGDEGGMPDCPEGAGGDRAGSGSVVPRAPHFFKAGVGTPCHPKKACDPPAPPPCGETPYPHPKYLKGHPPTFSGRRFTSESPQGDSSGSGKLPHPPPGLSLGWGPPATFFLPGIPPPPHVKKPVTLHPRTFFRAGIPPGGYLE